MEAIIQNRYKKLMMKQELKCLKNWVTELYALPMSRSYMILIM